jgi:alanine dehydrogenase
MIIGVPKEIKKEEYRVGITPQGVSELKKDGHTVLIEQGAGEGSGFSDDDYLRADADIVDRNTVFGKSDLIVKVKEPLPPEFSLIREGQALFTFLHLAPNRELTDLFMKKKTIAMGYETLEKNGGLPLLAPMSEIAGRMAPLMGAFYLQKFKGGRGVLPSGVPGVKPARALIIGAGNVGTNAARVCTGLEMDTMVINKGIERLERINQMFMGKVKTLPFSKDNVESEIAAADIMIGAVLVTGGKTPVLISRTMLGMMKKGSVIVDVSVDQGGIAETSRSTTHDNPVYVVDGIVHYCVANMPGAYPRTSTIALTNATLPYIKLLASRGIIGAIAQSLEIRSSVNIFRGTIVHEGLAESRGMDYGDIDELL